MKPVSYKEKNYYLFLVHPVSREKSTEFSHLTIWMSLTIDKVYIDGSSVSNMYISRCFACAFRKRKSRDSLL